MIIQGSQGSLNLYYKGLFISSFPLSKNKRFEDYKFLGEQFILDSMIKKNINIKFQLNAYRIFCDKIYERKKNKQAIRKSDHEYFLFSLFALLKLKYIDNDNENGYLVMSRKKLR
tara:strand:- start:2574 stop:2918 length:345 start_codon:yes stop_codon:yes gene_type:complete